MARQESVDSLDEPTGVSRLADHGPAKAVAEMREEGAGDHRVEPQAWRKLHQQRPQLGAKVGHLVQEGLHRRFAIPQVCAVSDPTWNLGCKLEMGGRARSPTLVGPSPMFAMKAGIDLDGCEALRVAL